MTVPINKLSARKVETLSKPRLISNNGPGYIAADLAEWTEAG